MLAEREVSSCDEPLSSADVALHADMPTTMSASANARMANGLRALALRRGRCWGRVDPGRVDALRVDGEVRGRADALPIGDETRGFVDVLRVDDGVRADRPLRFLLFIGVMVANGAGRGVPVHGLNVGFSNAAHSDFPPLTHVNGVNPIDTNLLLICSSHCWF